MAPELLGELLASTSHYNNKVDAWALGCILYELIFSRRPFQNEWDVINFVTGATKLKFIGTHGLCDDSKLASLILEILQRDPAKRPGATKLLVKIEHAFQAPVQKPRAVAAQRYFVPHAELEGRGLTQSTYCSPIAF